MKLVLISCLTLLALAGCSRTDETTNIEPEVSPESTQTEAEEFVSSLPDDAPVVTVASTGLGIPITYKNEEGAVVGIDVDVIRAVGEAEGFKVQVIPVAWADIFDETDKGVYDVALAGISWTPERAGKYSLTDAYFFNPASFIYKSTSEFHPKSLADLQGKRVGVLEGSKHEKMVKEAGINDISVTSTGIQSFSNLAQGNIDAYVHDNLNLRYLQVSHGLTDLVIEPIENESEKTANLVMVVAKDKPELLAKINDGLKKVKADGSIDRIVEKHLALIKEMPPAQE